MDRCFFFFLYQFKFQYGCKIVSIFQKIDVIGKLVEELMARTHELLQPNPGKNILSECRIKITSQLLSKSECRNLGHGLTQKTQTNKIAEVQHNVDKHYLFARRHST